RYANPPYGLKTETPSPMQSAERRAFAHRRGLIIVTTLATAYMASHFFRASNVTIGLDLMHDLKIGPEALGALTGAFFFGLATTPLAWAAQAVGWRSVFAFAVLFTALAAVAVWLVVRDAPSGHPFLARTPEPPRQMLQGLLEVLRNPLLRPILALNFCNYACT